LLFSVSGLAFGLLISALCSTVDTASLAAMVVAFLPAFLLSGFVFPLEQIPAVLDWLSYLMPARYMVELNREVFLKAGGFAEVWPLLAQMAGYSVVALAVASQAYRRRLR
jgi:ABC-2 type transport system permease protein